MATERFGHYFKYFPTRTYDSFDGTTQQKVVKDIFRRVRASLEARQDHAIYYNYTVPEKETPEIVSYKYYGHAHYHWVILLMNQIRDPQWGWPLDSFALEKYIVAKYGGTEAATQIHSHYETKEIKARASDDTYVKGDILLNSGITVNANFTYTYTSYRTGPPSVNIPNVTGKLANTTHVAYEFDENATHGINSNDKITVLGSWSFSDTGVNVVHSNSQSIVVQSGLYNGSSVPTANSLTIRSFTQNGVKVSGESRSYQDTVHTFTVDETLKSFSMYDKEIADNEKKRNIILLRRNLLQEFVDEFDELIIKRI